MARKSAADLSVVPIRDRFKMRGISFELVEVPIGEYDDLLAKVTTMKPDPDGGPEIEDIDESAFMRLLLQKSMVKPAWSMDELSEAGARLVRALERRCRALHVSEEPVTEDTGEDEDETETEDEDKAPSPDA